MDRENVGRADEDDRGIDCVIPVPLHPEQGEGTGF